MAIPQGRLIIATPGIAGVNVVRTSQTTIHGTMTGSQEAGLVTSGGRIAIVMIGVHSITGNLRGGTVNETAIGIAIVLVRLVDHEVTKALIAMVSLVRRPLKSHTPPYIAMHQGRSHTALRWKLMSDGKSLQSLRREIGWSTQSRSRLQRSKAPCRVPQTGKVDFANLETM